MSILWLVAGVKILQGIGMTAVQELKISYSKMFLITGPIGTIAHYMDRNDLGLETIKEWLMDDEDELYRINTF